MNRIIFSFTSFIIIVFTCHPDVSLAQTGTRIEGNTTKQPQTVVWFSEPTEITEIRLLLQSGKKQAAVDRARVFVDNLKTIGGVEARIRRYFGLSALCSALTATGELNEAIDSCSKAIDLYPRRWQALNNRGVAYYLSGQLDQALQDYNQALTTVQPSDALTELIQHNITLAEAKKSGDG